MNQIPEEIFNYYREELKRLNELEETKNYIDTFNRLDQDWLGRVFPWDYRFNSLVWAFDVDSVIKQIVHGYCWMIGYARDYEKRFTPGSRPSHYDFHISYYADNCITRISSSRDKLALMVWAYYDPFNPEKPVLSFNDIVKNLKCTKKQDAKLFLKYLEQLSGDDFSKNKKYRDFKIHRLEPIITISKNDPPFDWHYMIQLREPQEIDDFKKKLVQEHPGEQCYMEAVRKQIFENCHNDNVLFDRVKLKDLTWNYEEVKSIIFKCLMSILKSADGCLRILLEKPPFKQD